MAPRDSDDQSTDNGNFSEDGPPIDPEDASFVSQQAPSDDLVEHEEADPGYVVAAEVAAHERKIRWVVLAVIAGLIAFSIGATLLATLLSSDDTEAQIAGDIGKLSIPTLLTLLGAAVAWAYRRNNND
ncbi:hypothetical protein ACXYX3_27670 (plasmid) [Mycobacterium sp. C3-094]